MTMKQKQKIGILRGRGDSYNKIAAEPDIPINTVQSYCRRNGLVAGCTTPKPEADDTADVCPNCRRRLTHTPGSKRKRFCSDKCRSAWWKAHPEVLNRKAIYHFVCPKCGKAFESYGNACRKYCSRACHSDTRRDSE